MQQLNPNAIWLFFYNTVMRWLIMLIIIAFSTVLPLAMMIAGNSGSISPSVFLFIIVVPLFLVLSYLWAKLTYKYYLYELRDDGFRKEHGVIWKKYTTIPYERIQNVDIYRGLLARMLGLSDLHIQTAGASATFSRYGASGAGSEGRLPGLSPEVAEKLRDELILRAKGGRSVSGV